MVSTSQGSIAVTQGHVALYARDPRWQRALASSLAEAGHSHREAASPAEMHELLASQRFDVIVLKVRDEEDGREIADVLQDLTLPFHTILLGKPSALPLTLRKQHAGTFRYVPGRLPARALSRLVDASIRSGTWDDDGAELDGAGELVEIDLEDTIDSAAAAVYEQAKRKRQQFSTVVEGPVTSVMGRPNALRQTLTDLLRLVVTLAPRGETIAVEARAGRDEWMIRIRASAGNRARGATEQIAEALGNDSKILTAAARQVQEQGGMLWVELKGPAALALCLMLPLPPGAAGSDSAQPRDVGAAHRPARREGR